MEVLLVGIGRAGLGAVVPIFTDAGYNVTVTHYNQAKLEQLQDGYILKTPTRVREFYPEIILMDYVADDFDIIVTSVGRDNIATVDMWRQNKKLHAPLLLAENIFDAPKIPNNIPFVLDRICPHIHTGNGRSIVTAEDYYRAITLEMSLTSPLDVLDGVHLLSNEKEVEYARRCKLLTVNIAHKIVAIYGLKREHVFVEEAINDSQIYTIVRQALNEILLALNFTPEQIQETIASIVERFASPLQDPLLRIHDPHRRNTAQSYLQYALTQTRAQAVPAPAIEAALALVSQ